MLDEYAPNMERKWFIRTFTKGDEMGVFELWKAVHKTSPSTEQWMKWWNWMFNDNPADASRIWVADHKGDIVGFDAFIPVKMKVGEEAMMGSQNVSLMTHPHFRRQGIFLALAKRAFEELGKDAFHITYGFPNEAAYGGHMKTGWFDVGYLRTMIKPLNVDEILTKWVSNVFLLNISRMMVSSLIRIFYGGKKHFDSCGLTITKISSFDNSVDDLWNEIRNDHEIIVVRNMEYLNWRYVYTPNGNYVIYVAKTKEKICGYIVLGCRKQRDLTFGYIFDMVALSSQDNTIHCLILKAIEHFRREGADLIFYQIIGNEMYHRAVRGNGFISSRLISKHFRFIARANSDKISEEYLKNSRHWFIQIGDSDMA